MQPQKQSFVKVPLQSSRHQDYSPLQQSMNLGKYNFDYAQNQHPLNQNALLNEQQQQQQFQQNHQQQIVSDQQQHQQTLRNTHSLNPQRLMNETQILTSGSQIQQPSRIREALSNEPPLRIQRQISQLEQQQQQQIQQQQSALSQNFQQDFGRLQLLLQQQQQQQQMNPINLQNMSQNHLTSLLHQIQQQQSQQMQLSDINTNPQVLQLLLQQQQQLQLLQSLLSQSQQLSQLQSQRPINQLSQINPSQSIDFSKLPKPITTPSLLAQQQLLSSLNNQIPLNQQQLLLQQLLQQQQQLQQNQNPLLASQSFSRMPISDFSSQISTPMDSSRFLNNNSNMSTPSMQTRIPQPIPQNSSQHQQFVQNYQQIQENLNQYKKLATLLEQMEANKKVNQIVNPSENYQQLQNQQQQQKDIVKDNEENDNRNQQEANNIFISEGKSQQYQTPKEEILWPSHKKQLDNSNTDIRLGSPQNLNNLFKNKQANYQVEENIIDHFDKAQIQIINQQKSYVSELEYESKFIEGEYDGQLIQHLISQGSDMVKDSHLYEDQNLIQQLNNLNKQVETNRSAIQAEGDVASFNNQSQISAGAIDVANQSFGSQRFNHFKEDNKSILNILHQNILDEKIVAEEKPLKQNQMTFEQLLESKLEQEKNNFAQFQQTAQNSGAKRDFLRKNSSHRNGVNLKETKSAQKYKYYADNFSNQALLNQNQSPRIQQAQIQQVNKGRSTEKSSGKKETISTKSNQKQPKQTSSKNNSKESSMLVQTRPHSQQQFQQNNSSIQSSQQNRSRQQLNTSVNLNNLSIENSITLSGQKNAVNSSRAAVQPQLMIDIDQVNDKNDSNIQNKNDNNNDKYKVVDENNILSDRNSIAEFEQLEQECIANYINQSQMQETPANDSQQNYNDQKQSSSNKSKNSSQNNSELKERSNQQLKNNINEQEIRNNVISESEIQQRVLVEAQIQAERIVQQKQKELDQKIKELEEEIQIFQQEKAKVTELEDEYAYQLERITKEIEDFENRKEQELEEIESWKHEQMKLIEEERSNIELEKQQLKDQNDQFMLEKQQFQESQSQSNQQLLEKLKELENENQELRFQLTEIQSKVVSDNETQTDQKLFDDKDLNTDIVGDIKTKKQTQDKIISPQKSLTINQGSSPIKSDYHDKSEDKLIDLSFNSNIIDMKIQKQNLQLHQTEQTNLVVQEFHVNETRIRQFTDNNHANNNNTSNFCSSNDVSQYQKDHLQNDSPRDDQDELENEENQQEKNDVIELQNQDQQNQVNSEVHNEQKLESKQESQNQNIMIRAMTSQTMNSATNENIDQDSDEEEDESDEDEFELKFPIEYHGKNQKQAKVVEEIKSHDGKIQRFFDNGKKEVIFSNGVRREVWPTGYSIVFFTNNDIKQTFPDQKVVYYFAEAKTTQTTFPNGLQVFKFSNNQIEKHFQDGTKEISFPDGTIKCLFPDGEEESIFPDGTIQKIEKSGIRIIEFPNGQRDVLYPDGTKVREFQDGSIKKIHPDGRIEMIQPNKKKIYSNSIHSSNNNNPTNLSKYIVQKKR